MPGPFQDRGHGKSMDRIAMTFFIALPFISSGRGRWSLAIMV
jgi:hypothetical protein